MIYAYQTKAKYFLWWTIKPSRIYFSDKKPVVKKQRLFHPFKPFRFICSFNK